MNPSLDREPTSPVSTASQKPVDGASSRPSSRPSSAPTFLRGDWATWRSRAIAYTLCFAVLALALVGQRYLSRDLGPALSELRSYKAGLLEQAKTLTVEAQTLTSPVRVREFALASGMVPFSKAPKEAHTFAPLPRAPHLASSALSNFANPNTLPTNTLPDNALPNNTVEVETRWR